MIYILASASVDESNALEVKSIYITDESDSFTLTKRVEFSPQPSNVTKNLLFKMSKGQSYSLSNIMYSSLRELNDDMDAVSVANFLEGKIDSVRDTPTFDSYIFNLLDTFGKEVEHE
jgi:hypothetical protein